MCLCDPCLKIHISESDEAIFCFCFYLSSFNWSLSFLLFFLPASIPFFACELKAVTPYKRGFFCGDDSITYPYLEKEAIPDTLLIAGGIAITGLTVRLMLPNFLVFLFTIVALTCQFLLFLFQIALGECYRVRFRGVHSRAFVSNRYVSCLYKELGSFLFGCCVGQSLTNMAKLSVGRLRPNFLSVCNITYASIKCTPGSYIPEVNCPQPKLKLVEEARCVSVCSSLFYCFYSKVKCLPRVGHIHF